MNPGRPGELLSIDLGTSGVKVGLFARDGSLRRFAYHEYPLRSVPGRTGWIEQDPEEWWAAVRLAVREVLRGADPRALRAVCPGGQGPVLVLVDDTGRAVRPAISWMDTRSEEVRARMSATLGYEVTAFSVVPKLAWLAENEPDTVAAARWALQAWDFVGFRLTGVAVVSTFVRGDVWPRDWVAAAGLAGIGLLPRPVSAGEAYATTGGPWLAELGLPPGIPVCGSMDDGTGSMVGAAGGVVGRATDTGGRSGGLSLCWDQPLSVPGVVCWPSFVPGTYVVGGAFAAAGGAVDWWAAVVGASREEALARAERAPPGAAGLVFLPFLAGERAPYWDPSARGALLGLTFAHGSEHCARAVVESSGFALRLLAERLVAAGARIDELRVAGGQARSRLWNQIKADITGFEVLVPAVTEVALMGNAVNAAIGAGFYADPVRAAAAMVHIVDRLPPDPSHRGVYDELFGVYSAGYAALKPLAQPLAHAAAHAG